MSARRAKVRVPTAVTFQTKPELALALLDQAQAWGVPFACVVTDAGYGDNPTFLTGLDDRQVAYVVGVSSTFGVRLPDEVRAAALCPRRARGGAVSRRSRAPRRSLRPRPCSMPCRSERWQTITWREADGHRPPQTVCGRACALGHGRGTVLH